MKNPQNITIVLLTAAMLCLVAVLVGTYTTETANAEISVKGGDYIMTSLDVSAGRQVVIVIDTIGHKMNTYWFNDQSHTVELADQMVNLDLAFEK